MIIVINITKILFITLQIENTVPVNPFSSIMLSKIFSGLALLATVVVVVAAVAVVVAGVVVFIIFYTNIVTDTKTKKIYTLFI